MKKLYRSRRYRIIGGVAGGLAEYLDVDITITRLAIAVMALVFPNVVLAYILAWIIVPEAPQLAANPRPTQFQATKPEAHTDTAGGQPSTAVSPAEGRPVSAGGEPLTADEIVKQTPSERLSAETSPGSETGGSQREKNRQFFGYFLIAIGTLVLLKKYVPSFWLNLPFHLVRTWWPVVIIALGIGLIASALRRDN